MRDSGVTPAATLYYSALRTMLIDCPTSAFRSALGFGYGKECPHPFTRTAVAIIRGEAKDYKSSPLWLYQQHFRSLDESVRERLSPKTIRPWESLRSVEIDHRTHRRKKENVQRGARLDPAVHGWTGFRYMSDEKGEMEFLAIRNLVSSMQQNGYCRHDGPDGDIVVQPLVDGSEVRFMARSGKHRLAVAAALEMPTIPARVVPFGAPRLSEAANWPYVRSGRMSEDEAIADFLRIFNGAPDPEMLPASWR